MHLDSEVGRRVYGDRLTEGLIMKTRDEGGGGAAWTADEDGRKELDRVEAAKINEEERKLIFVDDYRGVNSADVYMYKRVLFHYV